MPSNPAGGGVPTRTASVAPRLAVGRVARAGRRGREGGVGGVAGVSGVGGTGAEPLTRDLVSIVTNVGGPDYIDADEQYVYFCSGSRASSLADQSLRARIGEVGRRALLLASGGWGACVLDRGARHSSRCQDRWNTRGRRGREAGTGLRAVRRSLAGFRRHSRLHVDAPTGHPECCARQRPEARPRWWGNTPIAAE